MDNLTFFLCVALSRESHPSVQGQASKTLVATESMWMIEGAWDDVGSFTDGIKSLDSKRVDSRFMVVPKIASELEVGSRNFIAMHPMARECGYLQMTVPNDVEPSESVLRGFMPSGASLNIEQLSMAAGEISSAGDIADFVTFAFESARAQMCKRELGREVGSSREGSVGSNVRL